MAGTIELHEWERNVAVSPSIIIQSSPLEGVGVFAKNEILEDEIILKIPKSSVLSVRNCGIASKLREFEHLPAASLLVAAYLYERSKGEKSRWNYYIRFVESTSIPDLLLRWTQEEQEWVEGTNVPVWEVADTEELMRDDFEAGTQLFEELSPILEHSVTFDDYRDIAMKVSSRAFEVDNFHGLAFVPGACFFNHSDRESVHFETDGMVCGQCGSIKCSCEHAGSKKLENQIEEHQHPQNSRENVCEIRTLNSINPGSELFNTYGEHPNGVLLSVYGFAIWNNAHDIVDFTIEIQEYVTTPKKRKAYKSWQRKQDSLGEEDSENDDEQSFVGVINNIGTTPRISKGLKSLASSFNMDENVLVKELATLRYPKYVLGGSSEQLKAQLLNETNVRKKNAIIAAGTEKLLLEPFLH